MPEVSLILPTYNAAEFLPECIRSIEHQTFQDLQIIFVDDGSTDDTVSIISRFRERDKRVKVFPLERNMGAGAARNHGLAQASGRFIRFVDADDFLPTDSVNCLYQSANSYKSDFARGNCLVFRQKEPAKVFPMRNIEWVDTAQALSYRDRNFQGLPWCHPVFLFSHDFLMREKLMYPHLRVGEDPIFLLRALICAENASTVSNVVYHYRAHKDATNRLSRNEEIRDYLQHFLEMKSIWYSIDRPKDWVDYFNCTFWWFWRQLMNNDQGLISANFSLVQAILRSVAEDELTLPDDVNKESLHMAREMSLTEFTKYLKTAQHPKPPFVSATDL